MQNTVRKFVLCQEIEKGRGGSYIYSCICSIYVHAKYNACMYMPVRKIALCQENENGRGGRYTCVYRCMHAFKSTILVLCRMGRSWQNTESGKLPCVRKMRKAGVVATCVYRCMHAFKSILYWYYAGWADHGRTLSQENCPVSGK